MNIRKNKHTYPPLYQGGFIPIEISAIEQVFLGVDSSPKRKMLASMLKLFIHKLQSLNVKGDLWVNGSFSTKNPEPMDIDLLLVIPRVTLSGMTKEQREELTELTDFDNREYVRAKWSCDLYVIESSNIGDRAYYEELFSRNPDSLNRKGIPVISL